MHTIFDEPWPNQSTIQPTLTTTDEEPEDDREQWSDGEVATYQNYYLDTLDGGVIAGYTETNDDQDTGYPSHYDSWPVRYNDHAEMLRRTGGCHHGIGGCKVTVILDGKEVHRH